MNLSKNIVLLVILGVSGCGNAGGSGSTDMPGPHPSTLSASDLGDFHGNASISFVEAAVGPDSSFAVAMISFGVRDPVPGRIVNDIVVEEEQFAAFAAGEVVELDASAPGAAPLGYGYAEEIGNLIWRRPLTIQAKPAPEEEQLLEVSLGPQLDHLTFTPVQNDSATITVSGLIAVGCQTADGMLDPNLNTLPFCQSIRQATGDLGLLAP